MARCSYSLGKQFLDKLTYKQLGFLVNDMFTVYIYYCLAIFF